MVVRSLFGMELSLASTLAKLKRCQQTPMSIPWGDHLELARCVAMIGEDDLREATTAMADACPTCSGICCSRPGTCAQMPAVLIVNPETIRTPNRQAIAMQLGL